MPELGKYADTVVLAYIVSFACLFGLIALTWIQSRRAKHLLNAEEANRDR